MGSIGWDSHEYCTKVHGEKCIGHIDDEILPARVFTCFECGLENSVNAVKCGDCEFPNPSPVRVPDMPTADTIYCTLCTKALNRIRFSEAQLKKNPETRRCLTCVRAESEKCNTVHARFVDSGECGKCEKYVEITKESQADAATSEAVARVVQALNDLRQKETAHLVGKIKDACGVRESETVVEAEKEKETEKKPKKTSPERDTYKEKEKAVTNEAEKEIEGGKKKK